MNKRIWVILRYQNDCPDQHIFKDTLKEVMKEFSEVDWIIKKLNDYQYILYSRDL